MFDINKISLMYLVVVVIYFLAVCQVDQASQAGTAGVQGKMHRYIYQSIRKLVIISPPSPPRLIQLTLVQRIAQFKQMGGDKMDR